MFPTSNLFLSASNDRNNVRVFLCTHNFIILCVYAREEDIYGKDFSCIHTTHGISFTLCLFMQIMYIDWYKTQQLLKGLNVTFQMKKKCNETCLICLTEHQCYTQLSKIYTKGLPPSCSQRLLKLRFTYIMYVYVRQYTDTILSKNKLSKEGCKELYHIKFLWSTYFVLLFFSFFFTLIKNTQLFESAIRLQKWHLKKIRRIKRS